MGSCSGRSLCAGEGDGHGLAGILLGPENANHNSRVNYVMQKYGVSRSTVDREWRKWRHA